ncbi:unnamed protein product [Durusdinium trenchii]|uniref:Uncharacterized protein n=1 Tax=Durusdinium trenchii TaxID=1381693 RepID=A0ABP0LGN1_9DINO
MWHQKIFAHRHIFHNRTVPGSPDFECILKSPSCHTLKARVVALPCRFCLFQSETQQAFSSLAIGCSEQFLNTLFPALGLLWTL